jgi:predicted regulator of Ras-like GTPase activity (Roadblock/LC7/MglB family)
MDAVEQNDNEQMNFSQKMRAARLVFYAEDINELNGVLESFLGRSQAKCVLLVDREGHLVTKKGFTQAFDTEALSALVAGSFASTREMARHLGETEFSTLSHQGKNEHLHIGLVAERALVVVLFDGRATLGLMRLQAASLSRQLGDVLLRAEERNKNRKGDMDEGYTEAAEQALDDFFGADGRTAEQALDGFFGADGKS